MAFKLVGGLMDILWSGSLRRKYWLVRKNQRGQ